MQIGRLAEFIRESAEPGDPIIVAGDFNDWHSKRSGLSKRLFDEAGLVEAFEGLNGRPARTFPAVMPFLTLDRIYVRGLEIRNARRLHGDIEGSRWNSLSDHAGLAVTVARKNG